MSVLRWRCLLSFGFSPESLSGRESCSKLTSPKYRFVLFVVPLAALTACVSTPPTRSIFKTPGINKAQWSRIQDECLYEAEKATAAADPRTAVTYAQRLVFNACAKVKGATFVGRVTMPDDQWKRISTLCKEEAAKAVAGQPASHAREQLLEDLEIECAKRNGAVFQQSLYP